MVTTFLNVKHATGEGNDVVAIEDIFASCSDLGNLALGLLVFVKKTVRQSDLVQSPKDRQAVKKGCKVAAKLLAELAHQGQPVEGL